MLDDCKGEKVTELLASFSTSVLRRVLHRREAGKGSITRDILLAEGVSSEESRSLLPLAIAHQSDLRKILGRKEKLRARYKGFGQVLDVKDKELDRRFEGVVETQVHLDENIPSEATVARIGKQLELHWQGDRRYIDVVAQGEDGSTHDALLDKPFQEIWPMVTDGSYASDLTVSRHGLLDDLERRVEIQNDRLRQWQELKAEVMKNAKPSSPAKQKERPASPRKASQTFRGMEKDLVFSPRKSPRKSVCPAKSPVSQTIGSDKYDNSIDYSSTLHSFSGACSPVTELASPRDGPDDPPLSNLRNPSESVSVDGESNEADASAEQSILQTLNASPTPMKPPLSLIERTRQSMAQASPGAKLSTQSHHPTHSTLPTTRSESFEHPLPLDPKATLLERTRQSISLVPSQPRKSIHNRRSSKAYPTNQFETPRKFGAAKELTPPDELFSPGAGYDSVFKSRPKVGFSPTATPEPSGSGSDRLDPDESQAANGVGLEESPLARLVAKA